MPATVASPRGALLDLIQTNRDYEPMELPEISCEYRAKVDAILAGCTYWPKVILGSARMSGPLRPPSMFRNPGFSVKDEGSVIHVRFHEVEDPDDLVW